MSYIDDILPIISHDIDSISSKGIIKKKVSPKK